MSIICPVSGSERRYDEYRRLYKPCDSSDTKQAEKHYHNNKDKTLEKKRNFFHNSKE